jgi:hypothetical protein
MTVNRTTRLNLPLPVTGTEPGTWGDTTNNGLTEYLDTAIAGTLSITASLTLSNSTGNASGTNFASTTAQYRNLLVPSSGPSADVVITAPSSQRTYHLVNKNATYKAQIRAGAGTGVTLAPNQSATVTYDGSDYVLVGMIQTLSAMVQSKTDSYTATLEDANKTLVLSSGASKIFTIPANASVAYELGTVLNFVNLSSSNLSIAITTDTMTLAGSGSTGTRTLAQYGEATARKLTSTSWLISGTNLT